jgi:hypothetical protein
LRERANASFLNKTFGFTHPPIPPKKWLKDLSHIYYIDMNMNFLALNDDVKFIIANHLLSDRKINKIFMNESDDNFQKIYLVK